jgi:hypothetical protein
MSPTPQPKAMNRLAQWNSNPSLSSACKVYKQRPNEGNSMLTCKHPQQSDKCDGWRGRRFDIDERVDQPDHNAENEREEISFHEVVPV